MYGTTTSTSVLATGHLLAKVVHPEQVPAQAAADRTVETRYNGQGQVNVTLDPAGSAIINSFDTAGRVTEREVLVLGTGMDGRVRKIQTTYTNRGQTEYVRQLDENDDVLDV